MKTNVLNYAFVFAVLTVGAASAADTPPAPPALPNATNIGNIFNAVPAPKPATAIAPKAATTTGGPKIQFASSIHDFGKINSGDLCKAEFIFTNVGTAILDVTDVRPGCGCTTAGQWTRQVEPGKTGTIPLQFNSSNFTGPVTKTATVTCNDPSQPTVILQLKANIWRAIEVLPQYAVLNLTSEAPSNSTTVRIVNNLDNPLTISDVESKNPAFATELKTIKEGKEYQVVVKTASPFPNGNVTGQITMKTSSTNMPVINITAWANMQQTVMAMPAQVSLSAGPLPSNLTQTVWIQNRSTNAIKVTEPTINLEGANVQLKEFQPGRYFSLTLTFPPGKVISQNEKIELTVKTSHPQYPVIRVPVYQQPPASTPVSPIPFNPMTPKPAAAMRPVGAR